MIACQLHQLLTVTFCGCVLLIPSKPILAEELLSLHLNRVAQGEFPAQHWYPQDRPSIEEELESLNVLVKAMAKLDEPAMREIKRAYADRAVIVRDLDVANLRARIDKVCETHQPIIERLKSVRWANPSKDCVPFTFIEQRLQVQSIAYLVNLYAAREFASGRIDSASQTLAGGYAFAHNLMRTAGDVNFIMGIILQSVLAADFIAVLAMVAMLAALVVIDLQQKREAAREVTCQNNLRNIGIAIIHYDRVHGQLPTHGTGTYNESSPNADEGDAGSQGVGGKGGGNNGKWTLPSGLTNHPKIGSLIHWHANE